MQQSDRRQFIALMADIGERYGKCIAEPWTVYWQAVTCFEWEDVENALQAHSIWKWFYMKRQGIL